MIILQTFTEIKLTVFGITMWAGLGWVWGSVIASLYIALAGLELV